ASLLFLGELVGCAAGRVVDAREALDGVMALRSREWPPRAAPARSLALMKAGAYSDPNANRMGLRWRPSSVALYFDPDGGMARSRKPTSSRTRSAPLTRASVSPSSG